MPVKLDSPPDDLVPPAPPPIDAAPGDLPADAVQIVPRVVATTDTTLDASTSRATGAPGASSGGAKGTMVDTEHTDGDDGDAAHPDADVARDDGDAAHPDADVARDDAASEPAADAGDDEADEWAAEKDW
jgi:hypothetical protein